MREYIKKNKKIIRGMVIFGVFPLLCAIIWCLCEGHGIWDVYLPTSYWNDELMYYKLVESVVNYGIPQGYFGYGEMHAETFYFSVWSPVVLIPWCIYGFIFGWKITSPIYANILYSMISMSILYLLVKPDKKQSVWILIFLSVYTPYTKYMLSGMPESICIALLVVFLGLSFAYLKNDKNLYLWGMFGIISFMTLYRPYIGVLFIIPGYFSIKKYKWKGIILSCVLIGITAFLYALITKYCCSPYIVNSINTEWIEIFATNIWEGIKYVFQVIIDKSLYLYRDFIKKALEWGLFSGSLYVTAGLLTILLSIRVFLSKKDVEDRDSILLSVFYIIGVVGVILAIFLFYQVAEGARHLMGLIVVGGVLLALIKKKTLIMKLIIVAMCSYFFIIRIYAPYDWQVPFDDGKLKDEVTLLEEQLDEEMVLSESGVPWDNTVIWLSYDMSGEEVVNPTWGLLYAIPEGFALNFCSQSYVEENLDSLKSRYIATWPGGDIEARLMNKGCVCIASTERITVYEYR